ncbi:MAG: polysaccharide biosynthesis C-terminal domain-containing protein [Chloroflexi bacterium]|nr:polysaccharide biosynthesis C-terminal domain-containing protein [Chloroflexota bacterium]
MQSASSPVAIFRKNWRSHASMGLAINVIVAIVGVLLARLLGSLTQVALARLMNLSDFGMYTTLYSLLGPVVMITSMGLDTWLLRQGGSPEDLESVISQVFMLRFLATGALMVVAIVVLLVSGKTSLELPIIFAALGLTFELLLTTAHTALRAQNRSRAAALLQVVVPGLTIVLTLALWNIYTPLLTATGYRLLADAFGVGLLLWLLRLSFQRLRWTPRRLWGMIGQARAYFAADLLSSVALKADLTMVAFMIGAVGAGIYSPTLLIINTTFLVPAVAWQVLLPVISAQQPSSRGFRWTVGLAVAGSVLYGLFWAAAFWWGSGLIIDLVLRAQYREAVPLLQIMCLIPLFKSLNFCSAMVMVARDDQVLRTKLLAVGSVVNVVANAIFIPLFGLAGAAWVNLATEIILLIAYSGGAWVSLRRSA